MNTTHVSPATHQQQAQRSRLAFTRIEVRKAPGISPGFTIDDLSPDINIIYGPNASGKSTTARAIQALIWPHPTSLRGHALAAAFDLGDDQWSIEADYGRVARFRDGEPVDPPLLAPIDDRVRYTLGLHDLLASENQPLAQAIHKESSGGFELDAVAADLGYRADVPARLDAARDVDASLLRLRDAERAQGEVASQARQLSVLRERERRARQARSDAEAIRRALQLAQARHDLAQARQLLVAFPAGLAHATGDEPRRIGELNERLAALEARRAELERARDRAVAERNATRLADQPINDGVLRALRAARDELTRIDADLAGLQRDLKTANAERQSHQRRLAADLSDAQIASLDTEGVRELAELSRAYDDIRVRRRAREEVEHWIGTVTPPANTETLREGLDVLHKRLQTPNAQEVGALLGRARLAAYVGGILVIAGAIWLATFVNPLWLLFAVLGLLVIFFAWKHAIPASTRDAVTWEQRYATLDLPQPASWTPPAIRERMNDLQEQLRVALVEQEKADRWAALEQERAELDRAYAEAEARRASVIARYGVAPDLSEASLRLLAENLGRWQAADTNVRAIEARLNAVGAERLKREQELRQGLGAFGYQTREWDEHIADLDERFQALQDASARAAARAQELENTIAPEIERFARARAGIFAHLGLQDGDDRELEARIDRLDAFREAQQAVRQREASVREADAALALAPQLRDVDPDELQRRLEAAEAAGAELDAVLREIGEIQTRIGDAKRRRNVEDALTRRDEAMGRLRETRDELASRIAGSILTAYVQQETRDAAMPIVFHRARELFSIITRGRYELEFIEGPPPAFTARDTSTGMPLHLDQLSSGTRVQLLMAIRLAFVENVESGPKLPVLLDETLGNSDELRAGAIIDAAIEISRNGRQVFYFTAQGDEVARWQARLAQLPAAKRPSVTVIDLAEVRRDAGFDRLPMAVPHAVTDRMDVPSPDGLDRLAYGQVLKVPGIDPWSDGLGGVHLWHLVDDLDALHTLLEQDVRTWGQLSGLVATGGIESLIALGVDEGVWRGAEARARLLETALATWRVGQAKPVSAGELAEAGVVPAGAMDRLSGLLAEMSGEGARVVARLRDDDDSPLDASATDQLEAWLADRGHLAQGVPVSREDLRNRTLRAARGDLQRGTLTPADIDLLLAQLPG